MSAREWFEGIRLDVIEAHKMKLDLEAIETSLGPHGQLSGSIGGAAGSDKMRPVDKIVDDRMREKLAKKLLEVERKIERATDVLYGRSGRGGLARARSTVEADCICGFYLQAMSWSEIGREVASEDFEDQETLRQWARQRAISGLRAIDRLGADKLANS